MPSETWGFYSNVLPLHKASGGQRLVIERARNSHQAPHFCMFTMSSVRSIGKSGDFEFKIDLEDAYFHIVSDPSRKSNVPALRLPERGVSVQGTLFDLSTAPQMFICVGHTVAGYLHRQGGASLH